MDKWLKIIKEQKLAIDIINVILGLILIVLAVIYFLHPGNYLIVAVVMLLAGTINTLNGAKRLKNGSGKASIGFFAVGILVYLIAVFILINY